MGCFNRSSALRPRRRPRLLVVAEGTFSKTSNAFNSRCVASAALLERSTAAGLPIDVALERVAKNTMVGRRQELSMLFDAASLPNSQTRITVGASSQYDFRYFP